jgi:hypothetical protein
MNLFEQHPTMTALAAYFVFSALVGGMPSPTDKSSAAYTWLYNSLHLLAGNISVLVASKYPQLPSGAVQVTETAQKTTTVVPDKP